MDSPEICVKHKFVNAETQTKDVCLSDKHNYKTLLLVSYSTTPTAAEMQGCGIWGYNVNYHELS